METNLAETQLEQPTAAPATTDSAPVTTEKVETVETSPPAKEPDWFRKRIDEITAKRHAELREADNRYQATARELEKAQRLLQERQEPEKVKTLADFEYDDAKYQSYLFDEAEKRAEVAARRVRIEEQEQAQAERRARKFKEREVSFEKETPDYRDVAHYAPINDAVAEILQELDSGPELAYYLGKNKDIALHLNDLPPKIAAVELGRIDAKITAEKAAKAAALEKAKAEKAVTNAPPPAPKIEGSNAQVEKDPSQMTDSEFAKWRKRQIAQRR
jgi:hypothetical protein